jgi:choice-of-anchor B domain-containing protein
MISDVTWMPGQKPFWWACCLIVCWLIQPAVADDDGRGRPYFKGSPANPTALMRRMEADAHSAQALSAASSVGCVDGFADGFPCHNVHLQALVPLSTAGLSSASANDVWGWTDSISGREFALIGLNDGTGFVEITDPANPVVLGKLPTRNWNSTWRDIKTYSDHAFIVSEADGHGMQVFDLTRLLDASPDITEAAHYDAFGSAHNIVINEDSGYAFAVGTDTCSGGLHMVDISNPTNPRGAGCYSSAGYTHDAHCVVYQGPDPNYFGREICINSNEDTLVIVDVTDKAAPAVLSQVTYPGSGYTHQGWLTPDHSYFVFGDELDEQRFRHNTRTRVFKLENLDQPAYAGSHDGTTPAIDHNQYVLGNHVYQANYRAGLRILELTDPSAAAFSEVAYFDVYPSSNSASYNGAWSVYPYFPSGNVVVSGIEQGLFVLRPDLAGGPPPSGDPPAAPIGLAVTDQGDGTALIEFTDESDNETAFEVDREMQHKRNGWRGFTTISLDADTTSYVDVSGSGTFRYRVRAVNAFGASDPTAWVQVTVTTSGGAGDGGGTKCHPKRGC